MTDEPIQTPKGRVVYNKLTPPDTDVTLAESGGFKLTIPVGALSYTDPSICFHNGKLVHMVTQYKAPGIVAYVEPVDITRDVALALAKYILPTPEED